VDVASYLLAWRALPSVLISKFIGRRTARNARNSASASGKFPTPLIRREIKWRAYIEGERMARAERKENGKRRTWNRSVDKFLALNKMAKPTLFVHRYFELLETVSGDAREIPFRLLRDARLKHEETNLEAMNLDTFSRLASSFSCFRSFHQLSTGLKKLFIGENRERKPELESDLP